IRSTWPERYQSAMAKLDDAVLNSDTFWKDKNPGILTAMGPDTERSKARIAVSTYLTLQNGGKEIPGGNIGERQYLIRIAAAKGWDIPDGDEMAAYAKIKEEATHRNDARSLGRDLEMQARRASLVSNIEGG